jgi:hypothetical protein
VVTIVLPAMKCLSKTLFNGRTAAQNLEVNSPFVFIKFPCSGSLMEFRLRVAYRIQVGNKPRGGIKRQPSKTTNQSIKGSIMEWMKPEVLLGSVVYALAGVLVFWLSFLVIDKLTPYNLWEEIVEKQNRALAVVVAAMSLGICIIVAAAIH